MNRYDALKVLGLEANADKKTIKKKYRALMHLVHPDARAGKEPEYAFSAREINAAYEYLISSAQEEEQIIKRSFREQKKRWNAPENENAYAARDIYQYIEGPDKVPISIAKGKFFWIRDEDYKLFLLSIYNLTRELLKDAGEEALFRYQGEVAYLLFQQFVSPKDVLERYRTGDDGIYYIPAMLETEGRRCLLKEGTPLYPSGVRNHRLYLKNEAGTEIGYISFADDLLYYAVVPMFEQRIVQVKIRISGSTFGNNNRRKIVVKSLDLWIRELPSDQNSIMLSISSRIEELLRKCRSED